MIIDDRVYGKIEIKEQVIIDLINSKPMQRLKSISQDGATHFIQPHRNVTRYEHSIGVWYLSHKYNRPIEEQIAALLHDIPHTAFSHVIDLVVEDEKHGFHDKFTKEIILKSDIPEILKKHNIEIEKVLEKEDYQLLENNLPDISVDRWDYFMRDGSMMNFFPTVLVQEFFEGIKVEDDKFYFTDVKLAALFAILFVSYARLIWLEPTSHGSYFLLAEALKIAVKKGQINQEDFFTNDEELMNKIKNLKDPDINKYLDRLKPGKDFVFADKESAEFYGPNKARFVNPLVKTDRGLVRLTEEVHSLEYYFEEFAKRYKFAGVNQIQ